LSNVLDEILSKVECHLNFGEMRKATDALDLIQTVFREMQEHSQRELEAVSLMTHSKAMDEDRQWDSRA
jgi:hypothetical protein